MKIKKSYAEKASDSFIFIAFFCVIIFLLFPEHVKNGASEGMFLAAGTVVPSVFPMLILSGFAAGCRMPQFIKKAVHKPLLYFFGLGADSFAAFTAGISGGYIISAKNALYLYNDGKISREEAKRLVLFFTCPGLSFCISIAGLAVMGSEVIGLSLFLSNISASFIAAFIYNRIKNNSCAVISSDKKNSGLPEILVSSVKSAAENVISISAWITAYGAFDGLSQVILKSTALKNIFNLSGEVTSALIYSSENYSISMTAFILSFGGLCVFLQLLPYLGELKIKPSSYIFTKLTVSFLSYTIEKLFAALFPSYIQVFSGEYTAKLYSNNIAGGAALLLLSVVFISFMNKEFNKKQIS